MPDTAAGALAITHTRLEGTLLAGTSRGDGSADHLKRAGWRWSRNLDAWYVPRSRDAAIQQHVLNRTLEQLRGAGFEVTVDIDDTARPTEDVELARAERAEARQHALEARAERRAAEAEAADQRARQAHEALPPGGEPIKVGHHSEYRHRRALERADQTTRRSIDADHVAAAAAQRAATAGSSQSSRFNPHTVANRIERLGAEVRRLKRALDADTYDDATGYRRPTQAEVDTRHIRLDPLLAEAEDQLTYWQSVRDEQRISGAIADYNPSTVSAGDHVMIRGAWYLVVRANTKSVTVQTPHSWTDRAPWHEVTSHRPADSKQNQPESTQKDPS